MTIDDNDSERGSGSSSAVSRRRLLQGTSVGLAGLLAGCQGGGGDQTTTATDTDGTPTATTEADGETTATTGETTETAGDTETTAEETETAAEDTEPAVKSLVFPHTFQEAPPQLQYNPINNKGKPPVRTFFVPLGTTHFGLENDLFYPVGCEDITVDMENGVIEYNLKDFKWWRPGPRFVDAGDLEALAIAAQIGGRNRAVFKNTESFKKPDERTLRMKMREPMNPGIAKTQAIERPIFTPVERWGEWIPVVEDARKADSTWEQNELEAITQEIVTWEQPNVTGNTLWHVDSINTNAYVCSINDGALHADKWEGVEQVTLTNEPEQNRVVQQFMQGNSYWTNSIPTSVRDQVPEDTVRLTRPNATGRSVGFQHRTEPFGNRRVRQAMMYIWNREDIATNLTESLGRPHQADEIITGVTSTEPTYFSDDLLSLFPRYSTDVSKAEELLSQVDGLTKPDKWHYNETLWEPVFQTQSGNNNRNLVGQVTVDQLNQADIEAQLDVVSGGKLWGELYSNNTFEQFAGATYGGWRPYPYNGLSSDLVDEGYVGRFGFHGAENSEAQTQAPPFGEEWDPVDVSDGDLETYNPPQMAEQLLGALSEDDARDIINRMAWVYSFQLPLAPIVQMSNTTYMRTSDFVLDADPNETPNHRKIKFHSENLINLGRYHPKRV